MDSTGGQRNALWFKCGYVVFGSFSCLDEELSHKCYQYLMVEAEVALGTSLNQYSF